MMDFFYCFKAMEIENIDDKTVTYRTSSAFMFFGFLFVFFGVAILLNLLFPGCNIASMLGTCVFCLCTAMSFILVGLAMITYKREVNVNLEAKKVEITNSSILGYKRSCIHFSEISGLEISKDCQSILGNAGEIFVVRVYVSNFDYQGIRHFSKVVKIFETNSEKEAREVAEYFTRYQNIDIINSCASRRKISAGCY